MELEIRIKECLRSQSNKLFGVELKDDLFLFQPTRKDVRGDATLVLFPLMKSLKMSPPQCGEILGNFILEEFNEIDSYEVVGGFLNLSFSDLFYLQLLDNNLKSFNDFLSAKKNKGLIMVEYSSPNTNKPLHLGHLRNIFLGDAVASILDLNGHEVVRTQIINDRGIHICKSMLAWKLFAPTNANGEKETPQNMSMKGDKFVGKYYVEFDKQLLDEARKIKSSWEDGEFTSSSESVREEVLKLLSSKSEKDEKSILAIDSKIIELAKQETQLMKKAKEMLIKWEARDPETYLLWSTMNGWVYSGFEQTYQRMSVSFDKLYYESDTYLTGKDLVQDGLDKGVFFRKKDNSIWVDLSEEGLDEKLLLRSDGTAVYMTQDLGTATERFNNYSNLEGIVYTVGNEQDYHFKVLFLVLEKLGYQWASNCKHLSYGMVDLPSGKMKSREGTVVDADELMDEVVAKATEMTQERGHIEGMTENERTRLCENIGLGGLKYYLLKVDPKKRMLFDPLESIDLTGNTGPFLQYAHARMCSLLKKAKEEKIGSIDFDETTILAEEKSLIKRLIQFKELISEAANNLSPALVANYSFDLVKEFNHYYQSVSILSEENHSIRSMRLLLTKNLKDTLATSLKILGIHAPEKM